MTRNRQRTKYAAVRPTLTSVQFVYRLHLKVGRQTGVMTNRVLAPPRMAKGRAEVGARGARPLAQRGFRGHRKL